MGYYIRVLATSDENVPLAVLSKAAEPAVVEVDAGLGDDWQAVELKYKSGNAIALIEKNPVKEGELGSDELLEFINEVSHYKPDSAVQWLQEYLPTVKTIYAFQLLSGTEESDGWSPLHQVHASIWQHAGGILQ